MLLLAALLLLMLVVAILIAGVSFPKKRYFWVIAIFMIVTSLSLYSLVGDKKALRFWLAQGEQHYLLLAAFDKLGGIDGAIASIKKRLELNPLDAQGWTILAKLYMAKQDYANAAKALNEAKKITHSRVSS